MKKILLMAAFAFFGLSNAQVKYGVKAGYNLSNLAVNTPASSVKILLGNKAGFHAGGFVEYGLNEKFALQGEVLYANLGGKLKADASKIPSYADVEMTDVFGDAGVANAKKASATININQISVPISAKYSFDNKVSVLGGFSVNFLTGVSTKAEIEGKDVKASFQNEMLGNTNIDSEIKKQISSTNFGLHIGAEYSISQNVFVDARYNFGLSALNKNFTDLATLKQRYFQLGVGYKF